MPRAFTALLAVALLTSGAQAHFLFLLPKTDKEGKPAVHIVLSDVPAPDRADLLDKIKQTEVTVRTADGKATVTKHKKAEDVLDVELTGSGPRVVVATCQYGVYQTSEGQAFLLRYYARTAVGQKTKDKPPQRVDDKPAPELALDIVLGADGETATVLWQGKPLPEAEVGLTVPGADKNIVLKSDKEGVVKLEKEKKGGLYAVRARHTEAAAGKLGDKEYKEVRHYCTLVFERQWYNVARAKVLVPRDAARAFVV